MEFDARTAGPHSRLAADLCIIGAGPAGLALAHAAELAGLETVLLESGGAGSDEDTQALNAGATTGDPYQELSLCRFRSVGGTAAIWNTWFEGRHCAKYVPLDAIDFEPRAWIPWSGWPFPRSELDRYYLRAAQLCNGSPMDFAVAPWNTAGYPYVEFGPGSLQSCIYHYGRADRFTRTLPAELVASARVTLVRGATVTELVREGTEHRQRVTRARWSSLQGARGEVSASRFVLAAGGIENARMLLLWLGERTWLGRGFMEHPVDSSLLIHADHAALRELNGFYTHRSTREGFPVRGRVGFSLELQHSEKLGNASIHFRPDEEPELLKASALLPAARRLVPFRGLRRLIGNTIRAVARARKPAGDVRYRIFIDLEQFPDPENRVALADERDRFGLRRATLHWRFREADQRNQLRVREVAMRELAKAGAGRIVIDPSQHIDPKHHHHAGTTRIHPDPELGVVDEQLRIHGVENLYVVGSSVFPTAGFANPTLTIVALSLRLADHLSANR